MHDLPRACFVTKRFIQDRLCFQTTTSKMQSSGLWVSPWKSASHGLHSAHRSALVQSVFALIFKHELDASVKTQNTESKNSAC